MKSDFEKIFKHAVEHGYTLRGALHPRWKVVHVMLRTAPRSYAEVTVTISARTKMWQVRVALDSILFDREFAEAVWGNWDELLSGRAYDLSGGCTTVASKPIKIWQPHLQRMAIINDRLKYLLDNLPEGILSSIKE